MPIQAMNAMRMPQFMPRRPPRRVGVDPALPELPDLEAEIPNFFFEPYLGPGQRLGNGKTSSRSRVIQPRDFQSRFIQANSQI